MIDFSKEDIYSESYRKHKGNNIRILSAMYKKNYYKFGLSGFFYLIKHSPAWLMPIVIANIVNTVIANDSERMPFIWMNAAVVIFLVILNVPMNYLHIHFSSSAIRNVEAGLRSAIIRKLQLLSIAFHSETQSGKLHSKVMRDVEAVQILSHQTFISLLNLLINISVALIITAFNNGIVFIFFLLTIPVASITIVAFRNKIREQNRKFRLEIEATSASVMDMEEMIPVTRAHGLEKVELKKMQKLITSISEEGYRLDIIQANFGSISWAIFQIFQIGCLVFSAYMVLGGNIEPGDIVLYQSYFATIVTQVSGLIMLLPTIAKGMESVESISEVLNAYDIEDNSNKIVLEGLEGRFDFSNVSFKYPKTDSHVLDDFSLSVKPGETIAFVGGSGAGKSTAMNLLIGFHLASKGVVAIDGNDMSEINRRCYRKHIAVVPQNTILFSGTIRENIAYGLKGVSESEILTAVKAANLMELIEALPEGLDTTIGERGNKLSGGQRQRIAIARAIIRNPKVIFFDEATSALDSVSETLILEAMDNLIEGRTTFVVAHRLSTIKKADRICVMSSGRCVELGTYDELMAKKGVFFEMKSLQA